MAFNCVNSSKPYLPNSRPMFYTLEHAESDQLLTARDPQSGVGLAEFPVIVDGLVNTRLKDTAAFGVLTYHFDEKADIQFGGRYSRNQQRYAQTSEGLIVAPSSTVGYSKENAFTYLVTPRYRFSKELMVYATASSGYRPGGPNLALPGVPATYDSDKTRNYELGVKGQAFNRSLTFAVAAYRIDWKNIQLLQADSNGVGFYTNSAGAKSEGVEASVEWFPTKTLSVTGVGLNGRACGVYDEASAGQGGDREGGDGSLCCCENFFRH